jgi:arginase
MKRLSSHVSRCSGVVSSSSVSSSLCLRLFATHSTAFPPSKAPATSPPPPPSPVLPAAHLPPLPSPSLSPPFFTSASLPPPPPFSSFLYPDRHVSIVGAPFAGGQPLIGVDLGPNFIRKGGLTQRLKADGWTVEDRGDVEVPTAGVAGVEESPLVAGGGVVGRLNELLYEKATAGLRDGHFLLTLGGDHSIGIGSISAVLQHRPETGIVWIDAHADINTPHSSTSRNPHGMVLAFLMDLQASRSLPAFSWMTTRGVPLLPPSNLVYIALRDLDPAERLILRHCNIAAFTMHDVDRRGIGEVMRRAVDHLTHYGRRPLHLSLDIDSIDPAFAPSTGTRVSGGLSYREGYYVCEALAETGALCSMDMVEVNPSLSSEEESAKTVQMAVGLIASAMGNKIL